MNTTNTEDPANQAPCASKPIAPMLVELAERMGVNPSQAYMTIKATIAPKATNEELMAFCVVANQYKLNPFLKEIYAFPGKNGGIVPIVGIDGWLKLINTHPKFDGMDVEMSGDGESCTCRIYRKDNRPSSRNTWPNARRTRIRGVNGRGVCCATKPSCSVAAWPLDSEASMTKTKGKTSPEE